jgi:hypothetical protein
MCSGEIGSRRRRLRLRVPGLRGGTELPAVRVRLLPFVPHRGRGWAHPDAGLSSGNARDRFGIATFTTGNVTTLR